MTSVSLLDGRTISLHEIESGGFSDQLGEHETLTTPIANSPMDTHYEMGRIIDRVHVYDYYLLDHNEGDPPPYSLQSEDPPPPYEPSWQGGFAVQEHGLEASCSPEHQFASRSLQSYTGTRDDLVSTSNPDAVASHQPLMSVPNTQTEELGSRTVSRQRLDGAKSPQSNANTLRAYERRMPWTVRPILAKPRSVLQRVRSQKEGQSSFQALDFQQDSICLKRKFSRRGGPTCIECWIVREKCVGDIPCDRCQNRARSIALKSQPCVSTSLSGFDLDALYLHLRTRSLEEPLVQIYDGTNFTSVSLFNALMHPSNAIRVWIYWSKLCGILEDCRTEDCGFSFPTSQPLQLLYQDLKALNILISTFAVGIPEELEPRSSELVLLVFAMLQGRATLCKKILAMLEPEMKMRPRSSPSRKPLGFQEFLLLVLDQVLKVAHLFGDLPPKRSGMDPSILLRPTAAAQSLIDHLARWLLFHYIHLTKQNHASKIFKAMSRDLDGTESFIQKLKLIAKGGFRSDNTKLLNSLLNLGEFPISQPESLSDVTIQEAMAKCQHPLNLDRVRIESGLYFDLESGRLSCDHKWSEYAKEDLEFVLLKITRLGYDGLELAPCWV